MANYRANNDSSCTFCHIRFQANAHVLLYAFTGKRGPSSVSSVASAATSRAPSTVGSSSISAAPARRQPFDPDGPIEPSKAYEYNEEDQPRHSTVAAMTDIFEDDYVPPAPSIRIGGGGTRPPGIDDPDYDPWNPPADDAPLANDQPDVGDAEPAWKDYDARRQGSPTRRQKRGKWVCPEHGPLCKPGICQEHARVERKKRLAEEQEKRKKEKLEREAKRAKALEKKEKKMAEARAEGSRSGGSSGSDSDTSRGEGTVFIISHTHTH